MGALVKVKRYSSQIQAVKKATKKLFSATICGQYVNAEICQVLRTCQVGLEEDLLGRGAGDGGNLQIFLLWVVGVGKPLVIEGGDAAKCS